MICSQEDEPMDDQRKSVRMMLRGEPFAEEDYEMAIGEIWQAEKKYNPEFIGYEWDDPNPRIQLEPVGKRGYIEFVPIKEIIH